MYISSSLKDLFNFSHHSWQPLLKTDFFSWHNWQKRAACNSVNVDIISFYKYISLSPVMGIKIVPEGLPEYYDWIN